MPLKPWPLRFPEAETWKEYADQGATEKACWHAVRMRHKRRCTKGEQPELQKEETTRSTRLLLGVLREREPRPQRLPEGKSLNPWLFEIHGNGMTQVESEGIPRHIYAEPMQQRRGGRRLRAEERFEDAEEEGPGVEEE